MKTAFISSLIALTLSQVAVAANEITIYSQEFKVNDLSEVVKCFKTDPNSRSYGVELTSVYSVEVLNKNVEDNGEAKLVSNAYNGLQGHAGPQGCKTILTEGALKQVINLTDIGGSIIYYEHLNLAGNGVELYGYGHGEIKTGKLSLAELESIIVSAHPGTKAKIYSDNAVNVDVVTTSANEEGMCQKTIVTKNKKSGYDREVVIMPLSRVGCGN